jgi:hypothetical protein
MRFVSWLASIPVAGHARHGRACELFAPDIKVGKDKIGRAHFMAWQDSTLRDQFTGTSHHLGQHIIEFVDKDHATGVVYSKNEHECSAEWVIMQMLYWDDYERIDGQWFFRRRLPCYWYATDLNKPPIGDMKMRWPGREPYHGAFHDLFPSWKSSGPSRPDKDELPQVAAPAPLEQFQNHAPWHTRAAHACALRSLDESNLFHAHQLGKIALQNRVVMAPMTRNRADADGTPTD